MDDDNGSDRSGPRRLRRLAAWVVVILVLSVAVTLIVDIAWWTALGAVALGALIFRTGWFFLQSMATPPPPPPDPGLLRKVKLTYQCNVCGAEVRMTAATTEDPEPPRHCMDEMTLITPID